MAICVHIDEIRLGQLWINLLNNTVKFTDQGTVENRRPMILQTRPQQ